MRIAPALLDQVVEHALRDAPDECCGVLAVRDGEAIAVHELENVLQGPKKFGFEIDGLALLRLIDELEDQGAELGVIYHSHTVSAPEPSQTDINFAALWPGVEWLIVGTTGEQPEVRSWLIDGAKVTEVPVTVAA
ncbi:M67 family metallopeptidase [Patulibacter defluvii]|uniref:M67 family metallopeptidase n=1 Tax=Patulibacter defluvii TaxID=3095358 RepID=UPI002A7473B3|nr:M67 family metallopeptidase [Patulibacter sp. DM4]